MIGPVLLSSVRYGLPAREEAARRCFDQHGHWPDEAAGRHWPDEAAGRR